MGSASSRKVSQRSDRELLQRFQENRDEPAITEIITRHAPLVRGVCQRLLGNSLDADDAFQATFLVLIRKGERVQVMDSLAGWLYGVAYRIARRQRCQRSRTIANVKETDVTIAADPFAELATRYDVALLEAELARLPEKYRAPIVLHHLAGKSQRDVAEELKLTEGAVDGLLKRGRQELRIRLARRGVIFGVTVAVLEQTQVSVIASETQPLIDAAVQNVLSFDPVLRPNVPRTQSARLAQQEINVMNLSQLTKVAAWTAVAVCLFGGAGLIVTTARHDLSLGPPGLIASELERAESAEETAITLATEAAEETSAKPSEDVLVQDKDAQSAPPVAADAVVADRQDSKLKALRQEKLKLLREVAAQSIDTYRQGRNNSFDDVLTWHAELKEAELDVCTTDQERIATLTNMLPVAKNLEQYARQLVDGGQEFPGTALKATVRRLDIEIALDRLSEK